MSLATSNRFGRKILSFQLAQRCSTPTSKCLQSLPLCLILRASFEIPECFKVGLRCLSRSLIRFRRRLVLDSYEDSPRSSRD
jgi:hypothetical protein